MSPQQIQQLRAQYKIPAQGFGPAPTPQQQQNTQAKLAALDSAWKKPDPLASVHIGGTNTQSYGSQVGQAFDQAKQQTDAATEKFYTDTNIGDKAEDILHATSGAASQITAPLAPVFKPLSEMIAAAGQGYATLKPVQDFAQTPAGAATERAAGDVADTSNIINTVAGLKGGVDAIPKIAETTPKVVSNIVNSAKNSLPAIKEALTPAPKAPETPKVDESAVVDNYYKAVKPSVSGKSTLSQQQAYKDNIVSARNSIIENKDTLNLTDKNGEEVPGQTPSTVSQLTQAIDQTKNTIYKQYSDLAKQAGEKGVQITTEPIAKDLDTVINSKALQVSHPEAIKYAQDLQARLQNPDGTYKSFDPETTQELIKNYNSSLEAFYKNPTYDNASKAAIDAGVVRNFREALDAQIQNATGKEYQALKTQYGALKAIEADVNKRALVLARQMGGGLADYAQIFSGGDMVHGILSLNPALFAKGAAQSGLTKFFQYLKSPDRAIQKMFEGPDNPPKAGGVPPPKLASPSQVAQVFKEFEDLPKGISIENPTGLVKTSYGVSDDIKKITGASGDVSFTRRSIKHLAEKGDEGARLINTIPEVLKNPDEIRQGDVSNRFLISKIFKDMKRGRPHVVNLEIVKDKGDIIVTSFQSDMKYLSVFELLWKTGGSSK